MFNFHAGMHFVNSISAGFSMYGTCEMSMVLYRCDRVGTEH